MEHKKIGKLALTSGTWKSNLIMVVAGILINQFLDGALFELIGAILLLVGLLNLIVFGFQAHFKKK